jgi:DinB superfamily
MPNSFTEPNRAAFEELRTYVEQLTDEQLHQAIDDEWTVTAAIAHIAFWDRQRAIVVERILVDSTYQPLRTETDVINATLFPQWRLLAPKEAIADMIEAGELVNRTVDLLDEETAQRLQSTGAVNVLRARHRLEHLEQIKQHLA